ncbi:MAG: hypothetical protein LN566_04790, partial [Rickettsia endosymbiont of Stiretrus anchorago]|nr:hypothetical protein [Rickettsia endosymbiont of Stiretrus anchorago]
FSSYLPMALRLEENYKIDISCSDHYDVYGAYKIAKQHYFTKKETALIYYYLYLVRNAIKVDISRYNTATQKVPTAQQIIKPRIGLL